MNAEGSGPYSEQSSYGDYAAGRAFKSCLWLFVFLFAFRLVKAFVFKRDLSNDYCELDRIAFALSGHMGFADPFKIPTGPTSHSAPAYPVILAAIYQLFGKGSTAEAMRQILSCGVSSLQFALLPALAVAANMSPRVGVLAGLLGGLSPLRHWIETKATFEAPYTALLLVILSFVTLKMWKLHQPSGGLGWFHGAGWGTALLFAPNLLPVLLGYLVLGAVRFFRSKFGSYLRYCLTLLFATGIVLTPWTLRNYYTFHHLIFVRGNFGLELSLSNNDEAVPLFEQNLYTEKYQNFHPSNSIRAAQEVKLLGESAYYDRQLHDGYQWVASHPGRFLHLTAKRMRYFWFPPLEPHFNGMISSLLTWCMTLIGIAGLFAMLENDRQPALAIGVIWLTYPLVYYVLQFDLRYRYPIEWTFLFAVSYGFWAFLARQNRAERVRELAQAARFC